MSAQQKKLPFFVKWPWYPGRNCPSRSIENAAASLVAWNKAIAVKVRSWPTLMLRDAAVSSGFQQKYTEPKKECCHVKSKRVPFWCCSVLFFDWTTGKVVCHVFIIFRYFSNQVSDWTSTIWVWIDLGHVAQSKSFLCSKSNFSLRIFSWHARSFCFVFLSIHFVQICFISFNLMFFSCSFHFLLCFVFHLCYFFPCPSHCCFVSFHAFIFAFS